MNEDLIEQNMCMFIDDGFVSFRYLLFAITLLGSVTLYHQFLELKIHVDEAKANSTRVPVMDANIKNIQRTVFRLKEDLTDSRAAVKKLKEELRLMKSDKTGLVDYAYGGRVMVVGSSESLGTRGLSLLGVRICGAVGLEQRLVEAATLPGDCWPLQGQEGAVVVQLLQEVVVTKVSLEHAARDLLPEGSLASAPREFSLTGLPEDSAETVHFFGKFEYSTSGPEVQTFTIPNQTMKPFRVVEFRVLSNHGHPDFTCVYRLRVHGNPTM